jgi:hypothetical protein
VLLKILLFVGLVAMLLMAARFVKNRSNAAQAGPRVVSSQMGVVEAQAILGLEGATPDKDAVVAAHRRLMQRIHPDKGGSAALAQQLNEAKRVLLAAL